MRYLRFPIGGHLVTITVEPEPGQLFTAEDIDEIKALLEIWRKGQARADASRIEPMPLCETHPSSAFDKDTGCRACVLGWPPEAPNPPATAG